MIQYRTLHIIYSWMILTFFSGCKQESSLPTVNDLAIPIDSLGFKQEKRSIDYDVAEWLELTPENSEVMLDIRYATENNFTGQQIYDCARCFLRPDAARKVAQLNRGIKERYGLRLKLYDCYRPRPFQQKLWDIVPNPSYVTPPEKGSMHNRGLAIDVTLVDEEGNELNMGTDYDFFGEEAHTDNLNLPEEVLRNRQVLARMMEQIGFEGIRTEWWHFSYPSGGGELSDWTWNCDD